MSEESTTPSRRSELSDLEPLDDLPEIEELPEVEELPEIEDLPDVEELPAVDEVAELEEVPELPAEAAAASAAPSEPAESAEPERKPRGRAAREEASLEDRPPTRELEKAPLHLRTAAIIVAVASLLPWLPHQGDMIFVALAKLVVFAGAYVMWASICVQKDEAKKVPGVFSQIPNTEINLFIAKTHLLTLLGTLIVIVGCLPLVDAGRYPRTEESLIGMAEKGMLAWAAATWVHIYAYERWGNFNPLFPLMFLAMAAGGILAFAGAATGETVNVVGMIGSVGVSVGGFFAVYTMWEAMKQAKAEGDAKRAAAMEARREARKQRQK